jgi:hypothetical protein
MPAISGPSITSTGCRADLASAASGTSVFEMSSPIAMNQGVADALVAKRPARQERSSVLTLKVATKPLG